MVMRQDNVAGTQEEEGDKRFYLQYSFPPSCVGETGRVGAVGWAWHAGRASPGPHHTL